VNTKKATPRPNHPKRSKAKLAAAIEEPLKAGQLWALGLASADHPWDKARKLTVVRHDYRSEGEVIDAGVNFFVLMLEHLGARPQSSCEGHPHGFYVEFYAPHELARAIARCGFFSVEMEQNADDYWSIRLPEITNDRRKWGDSNRRQTLRWAAESWAKAFLSPTSSKQSAGRRFPQPMPDLITLRLSEQITKVEAYKKAVAILLSYLSPVEVREAKRRLSARKARK
jgi:hypothetical protein